MSTTSEREGTDAGAGGATGDGLDPRHMSCTILEGASRAGARAMLKGVGYTDDDLSKSISGIASTWI